MKEKVELNELARKKGWKLTDFPEWANNTLYMTTIQGGYLQEDETPKDGYRRLAKYASFLLKDESLEEKFFDILWNGWLVPSTPVMSNFGGDVALPISCFGSCIDDSLFEINRKCTEMSMLSKYGGGTSFDFSSIRPIGTKIKNGRGGTSDGIIPFIKQYDSAIIASKQGKCYIEGTEVLTNLGFVDFRNVTKEHLLAQVDDERNITFTSDYELVNYNINETLYSFSGKKRDNLINLNVTGNHRMVIERRKDTSKMVNSKRVRTSRYWSNKLDIVEAKDFNPHRDNRIHVAGFIKGGKNQSLTPQERFMIAYQADGGKTNLSKFNDIMQIVFHFSKDRKIERLKDILDDCGFEYNIKITKENTTKFYVTTPKEYVKPIFDWIDLKNVTVNWCDEFLDELSYWDSHKYKAYFSYSTTIYENINIIQAIASLSNKRTTYAKVIKPNDKHSDKHKLTVWDNYKAIGGDAMKKGSFEYSGNVYCAVVPEGKLIVRSNNMVSVCGNTRRGAVAIYLNAEHKEYSDFLEIREPKGDIQRQAHNIHQGAIFTDEFMNKVIEKNGKEREIWLETIKKRVKTGEPYTMFIDNANKVTPEWWKKNELIIRHSNLCSEIFLPDSGKKESPTTFVCCLSALNLARYEEWKDTDTIFLATLFLDAVMEDFIQKGESGEYLGIEDAVSFAKKSRALGLGALGWHSFLQSKMLPFTSIASNAWTNIIFKQIKEETEKATLWLGEKYGEPEWCKGTGRRNLTLIAIAPNRSSSLLVGNTSQGIEPIAANLYMDDNAKGLHIRRNPYLEKLLEEKGKNISQVWDAISDAKGSVMNVRCLSDEEKQVFLTFREINQLELVKQAGIRQKYIDQGQSINLAFFSDAPAKFINQVHIEAWKLGLKSLYYLRSESNLKADTKIQRDLYSECLACEG